MSRYDANSFAEDELNPFAVSFKPFSYLQSYISVNAGILYPDLV